MGRVSRSSSSSRTWCRRSPSRIVAMCWRTAPLRCRDLRRNCCGAPISRNPISGCEPMLGLMMDAPLLVSTAIEYAAAAHGDTEIVARTVEGGTHRYDYRRLHSRVKRFARALERLGVRRG